MEKLNSAIEWYQHKIGAYDKQLWERSVEQKVLRSIDHVPKKSARVKPELIDVDLVKGSTFSKTKPQQSWLSVSQRGILRVVFMPVYLGWWCDQISRLFASILLLLYILMLVTTIAFLTDSTDNVTHTAMSTAHITSPWIMLLIMGILQSSIGSPRSIHQKSSHRERSKRHSRNQTSKSRKRKGKSSPRLSFNQDESGSPETGVETNLEDSGEFIGTKDTKEYTLHSKLSNNRIVGRYTDKGRAATYELNLTDYTDESRSEPKYSCIASQASKSQDCSLSSQSNTNSSLCSQSSKAYLNETGQEVVSKSSGSNSAHDVSNLGGHLNGASLRHNGDAHSQNGIDSDREQFRGVLPDMANNYDNARCGKTRVITAVMEEDILCGNSSESLDDFKPECITGQLLLPGDDQFDLINGVQENSVCAINSVKKSDNMNCDDIMKPEKQELEKSTVNSCPLSARSQIPIEPENIESQHTRLKMKPKISITIPVLEDEQTMHSMCSQCGNRLDADRSSCVICGRQAEAHSGISGQSGILRRRGKAGPMHTLPRPKESPAYSSCESEVDLSCPNTPRKGQISEIEWEEETINTDATSSDDSSPCTSSDEDDALTKSNSSDNPFEWTQNHHNVSSVMNNLASGSDKVSCMIWEKEDVKKVDLTVLDIGASLISKVDKIPQTADYVLIGTCLATMISLLPLCFRAFNTRSMLEEHLDVVTPDSVLEATSILLGKHWRVILVMTCGTLSRFCLAMSFFFLLSVAERTFKQRLLYAKHFCYLTSSRRAKKYELPHFRLNKVRNIKTWLSLRSYLKKRGPQRSVDTIVSAAFLMAVCLLSLMSFELLNDSAGFLDYLGNWEVCFWCLALGIYLLRFMILGTKINKKYRNFSVLITEQINLYLHMEQKPHKKEELMLANAVLKLAEDLLKELESPFKISGLSANPVLYNITKVVILSAFSAVLTELLGFKLKLYKIKLRG